MDDDDDDELMDIDDSKTVKIGSKRGSNSNATAGTPKKRPVVEQSPSKAKPNCKYGVKCYQKGEKHRDKFAHPWVSN